MENKCGDCGADNPDKAEFCQKCGEKLNNPKKPINPRKDIKGVLNSISSRNKIILGVGAIVIVLVIFAAFFAFAKIDATLNVNSATYVDNIIGKQPVNGKFLLMNVTVKNNGNDPLTVSTGQFAPYINGKPVDKYSVFSGAGTDMQNTVKIPVGGSQNMILAFDIGNQTPDTLVFQGPLLWSPNYKTNTSIKDIGSGTFFNGMTYSSNMNIAETILPYMGVAGNIMINGTVNTNYQKSDDPNKINYTTSSNLTVQTFINGQESSSNSQSNTNSTIDIKTGLNQTGGLDLNYLPKNLTKPGDSITAGNKQSPFKNQKS